MSRVKQAELIKQMSSKEITFHLLITQVVLLLIAIVLSLIFFSSPLEQWIKLFEVQFPEWVLFGVIPGLIVISVDFLLIALLPERYYDDGGINKKVFENQSVLKIFLITLLIAICEEALFRGVLQTQFGFVIASTLFALIHFRYLKKVVLFVSVLFVSYFIGYIFHITGSLPITITSHFLIDFLLGLWIYSRSGEGN
ncbi:CPBP family intramembrane metalloprotease [Halobacillus sp. A1]|uniref:CPBP family intramembrane glutamic endopeptidase n=1 Tax=Halobacillus sp. A1 TaxID=2880262 RepID=UPI0020A6988D|nr:CPBP family intramembrane glutamic endopeptidase [Halobacillus sp. A1]MCP3032691.1 CPBP family intramembrane metalloprotease [Halobacillus sp. A1]